MTKTVVQKPIEEQKELGEGVWAMTFIAPEIASQAVPGQFVHMCIPGRDQPFLRRPFSLAGADKATGKIDILYRVVGDGTRRFSELKAGDLIDCMGPLGGGFALRGKKPLLIGGGMGIAPLVMLAKHLKTLPVALFLGARNKGEMFWPSYFPSVDGRLTVATDDGSIGLKGNISQHLDEALSEDAYDAIYTCGPKPMMEAVAREAKARNIFCQVSLEDRMGCGVGACLSCTFEATDGTRRKVCTDGPVFDALEVFP